MNIKAHLDLPPVKELMKNCGLNEGGKVQKDSAVRRQEADGASAKSGWNSCYGGYRQF